MLVTIYTDASFSHTQKDASYACWIKCNLGTVKHCDVIPFLCECPNHAEMYGICKSVVYALGKWGDEVSTIFINTDSQFSIKVITGEWYRTRKSAYVNLGSNLVDWVKENYPNVTIRCKYVKAHTGKNDKRSFINDWCDKSSKSIRQKQRKKVGVINKSTIGKTLVCVNEKN